MVTFRNGPLVFANSVWVLVTNIEGCETERKVYRLFLRRLESETIRSLITKAAAPSPHYLKTLSKSFGRDVPARK